jgi:N-acetylmuramoyl-L-alanine amidase
MGVRRFPPESMSAPSARFSTSTPLARISVPSGLAWPGALIGVSEGGSGDGSCGLWGSERVGRRGALERLGRIGRGLLGGAAVGLGLQGMPARGMDWTLLQYGGRDYLPLRQIGLFYRLGPLERTERQFSLRIGQAAMRGESDSQEFFISHLKFILSYPIREVSGELCMSRMDLVKVVDPVLRPSKIVSPGRVDTIVLDAGHGGSDGGAGGILGKEKDYTWDVVARARLLFLNAGYHVHLTRVRDEFVSLEERSRFANQFERALFLSVHFNASGKGTGVETFTLAPRGVPSMASDGPAVSDLVECPGNARDAENMALATATHASLVAHSRLADRGIKRARFFVIRETVLPSVLLEGGFMTNPEDMRRIATAEYRQGLAQGMVEAVRNYRRALTPEPAG